MKKSLMSFAIGLLSTYSCWAFGLSLGEIQLKSNLNEPLRAEINLTQVRGLTPQELLVGLAPKEDFEAHKVERVFYLADLKFRIEVKGKDAATIYVTSGKAIQEPYLNFLVEVNWPAGRLVREYTLLIDPPTSMQDAVAQPIARTKSQDVLARVPEKKIENVSSPVASSSPRPLPVAPTAQKAADNIQKKVPEGKKEHAAVAPKASAAASKTAALDAPKPAPSSPKAAAKVYEANDGKGYTVQQNETLWDIAVKVKPEGASLHQTIVALYQANSDAFIQQNMNLVKKGAVLRVPSADDAKKITRQDAIEEMARQSKLWQAKVQVKSASQLTAENIDASGRADRVVSSTKDTNDGKLTLASMEGNSGSGEGKGKSGGSANTTLLEERLDQAKLQNTGLSQSVKELSQQVKTSEKVLKLKDDKIAVLEAKLKQLEDRTKQNAKDYSSAKEKTESVKSVLEEVKPSAQASITPSTTGFASSEPIVTTSDLTSAAVSIDTITSAESLTPAVDSLGNTISDPVTTAAAPDQPQALEEPPADNALSQAPEDQEAQKMQEEMQEEVPAEASLIDQLLANPLYLAAAATIVAVVVGVFVMRRRRPESEEDLTEEEMMEAAEQGFTQDELVGDHSALDFDTDAKDKKSTAQEETVVQSAPSGSAPPIIDVQDIIGEADIFLAYGRFDQAAGILQKTIKQIPNDTSLRLKLMEVFVESRDVEGFLLQEKAIASLGDPEVIHKAQQLRKKLGVTSEAAQRLSQEMLGAGVEEEIHSATDEDIGAESTQEEESDMLTQNSADLPSLSDLESSLTHGLDEEEKEQEHATALSNMGTGESDGLDFDLNLDDDEDDQVKQKNNETLIDSISQMPTQAGSSAADSVIDEEAFELDLSLIESDDKSNTKSSEFELDLNELDDLDIQPSSMDTSFDTKAVSLDSAESDLSFDLIDLDQDDVLSTPVVAPPASAAVASKAPPAPAVSSSGQNANDLDDDFSFLESTDQVSNSLDLAKAYLDMGDIEGAKDILAEVLEQGDTKQKDEARTLLKKMPKHA